VLLACAMLGLAGCGEQKFKNEARPSASYDLTGVIQPKGVQISPDKVGAGPVMITISNQTKDAHTVTLSGESVQETVGPIQPRDTGTIQKTLKPGVYMVKAGSDRAVMHEIPEGQLKIGKKRGSSNNQLLLP
jgi:hypothetical protein